MSTPSEFLKDLIGNPVVVKLNSGVDYRGILNCLDGYMNIALEQTEEYVNGQLKKKYGDVFIRWSAQSLGVKFTRKIDLTAEDPVTIKIRFINEESLEIQMFKL